MSEAMLEIQRATGTEPRSVADRGDGCGIAEGSCPGCGAEPFLIRCHAAERHGTLKYRAGARCVSCDDPVGWAYSDMPTIFGDDEDRAVLTHGRGRVYHDS